MASDGFRRSPASRIAASCPAISLPNWSWIPTWLGSVRTSAISVTKRFASRAFLSISRAS